MVDSAVIHGTVVTGNDRAEVIENGGVAIRDGEVIQVDTTTALKEAHDLDHVIDADGGIVLPGLIDTHVHVSDILLRGRSTQTRDLHDWLATVKWPGTAAMDAEDHELAAALFCREALEAGVTTFVENDGEIDPTDTRARNAKFDVYQRSGIRHCYGRGIRETPPGGPFRTAIDRLRASDPQITHPPLDQHAESTDEWADRVLELIEAEHGRADGRRAIWPAPIVTGSMTDEGLSMAYDIAAEHDVMSTVHVAETVQANGPYLSDVQLLQAVGGLGPYALLGHCVHVDERDIRTLATTNTSVAHNVVANGRLGTGVAPVPTLRAHGVPVGIGTDNASLSDTVDPLADLRVAAVAHAAHREDAMPVSAADALAMATGEAARAINHAQTLGTLAPGYAADIIILDVDKPALTPSPDPITAAVYQADAAAVDTVICDGEVVVRDGVAQSIVEPYPDLLERAREASERIADRSGLSTLA